MSDGKHTCTVSSYCASLIYQPWMRKKTHTVSTRCEVCKRWYYWWPKQQWVECKADKAGGGDE
jgi:hypothetical protein